MAREGTVWANCSPCLSDPSDACTQYTVGPYWLKGLSLEKETSHLMLPSFYQKASSPTSTVCTLHFPL